MKLRGVISAANLVLCLIGSASAGPVEDAERIFWALGGQRDAHAECIPSLKAVRAAHPGSRPTWRLRLPGHEGEKCWFAASKSKVTNADASRDAGHEIRPVSATSVPLPRPRSQDTLADAERGPLSILIWGRPMGVDATWEEMFAGRARGAE
jgi:hypothetical protein